MEGSDYVSLPAQLVGRACFSRTLSAAVFSEAANVHSQNAAAQPCPRHSAASAVRRGLVAQLAAVKHASASGYAVVEVTLISLPPDFRVVGQHAICGSTVTRFMSQPVGTFLFLFERMSAIHAKAATWSQPSQYSVLGAAPPPIGKQFGGACEPEVQASCIRGAVRSYSTHNPLKA